MPEIIDLEVSRENILKKLKNKSLKKLEITSPKVLENAQKIDIKDSVEGAELIDINRVSKVLAFLFEDDVKLVFHLMLHGDFCWKSDTGGEKNVVCSMEFENDTTLLIKDWSRWMKVELVDKEKGFESDLLSKDYGVNPMSEDFTQEKLEKILENRSRAGIKSVLMDQEEISGLGNAYTDEILWNARIDPRTKSGQILKNEKLAQLYEAIQKTLEESMDIVRELSKGEEISEQERDFMAVHGKSGQTCPECDGEIIKIKVSGRGTYICERCQVWYQSS
jgi:formamidopyrimidine-DNA glycosylase